MNKVVKKKAGTKAKTRAGAGDAVYTPPQALLKKYADVMIRFALNGGAGIKKGDVVYLVAQKPGLPLAKEMYKTILAMGGFPIVSTIDDEYKLLQVTHGSNEQLSFFPEKYYRGLADSIDHWVRIVADEDPMYLKNADPAKVLMSNRAAKPFREWLDEKEDKGKFTWTLCLYATEKMAAEAGLSLREYWSQIAKACYLNEPNPVAKWKSVFKEMQRMLDKLNKLPIKRLHVAAKETDLWITLGQKRKWLGGSGRNIPSFEFFTSPDWRGTEGKIYFDLPLYRYGNVIKDIRLEFKKGQIVKATAKQNEKMLKELIKQKNADKIGEFSLTDTRFSKITKFMAETLFDENFGGKYGNTHLAVGKSYHDTYAGNTSKMTEEQFEKLGFNHAPEHTDIIATTDRTVTAEMKDGSTMVIYSKGKFTI
ncbi:MAG: aminopeptidase [Chitinispirillia bacterium]|nr:aminopeptidase [Chitinispirillia bacterium]MCL2268870.1 aminopeptidase [Chitinispirillia bacterium]